MQILMSAPAMLVRPNHYVTVQATSKGERVVFGRYLPLSKRAATQHASTVKGDTRVIMRKTAQRAGLL